MGPCWVEHGPNITLQTAAFSTTPFSRHRGHEKSKTFGRCRVPKKQFFEDVFASCQASWSQRGRLEQLRKIMKVHWFLRYAMRFGHFRNARNKSNNERNICSAQVFAQHLHAKNASSITPFHQSHIPSMLRLLASVLMELHALRYSLPEQSCWWLKLSSST